MGDEVIRPQGAPAKVRVSLTEDQPVNEDIRNSLQAFLAKLSVPQKVELAGKGNREVRSLLARDPSSMVGRAVLNSPRLSELDVLAYAASPLTNDEVLRGIAESKTWARNTRVIVLIVSNPRTPPAVAVRFLGRLPVNDLKILSLNRNISIVVRNEAKRRAMLARR
ncbi:MAG: hypothetical protein ACM31I_11065 [Deltaproteobacteria bacterium]